MVDLASRLLRKPRPYARSSPGDDYCPTAGPSAQRWPPPAAVSGGTHQHAGVTRTRVRSPGVDVADRCGFCDSASGPLTRIEGLFPVLICPVCLARRARGRGPDPELTDGELRAGLDPLPTWALAQKAAAFSGLLQEGVAYPQLASLWRFTFNGPRELDVRAAGCLDPLHPLYVLVLVAHASGPPVEPFLRPLCGVIGGCILQGCVGEIGAGEDSPVQACTRQVRSHQLCFASWRCAPYS
jgi:hypothetical protein